jgi:alpha-ketoglutarate-dependent taurine dioxygenase
MAAQVSAAILKKTAEINVKPINGFIGAEIEGVDLRKPLSPEQFQIVHDAFVNYEVIVLRDQDITASSRSIPSRPTCRTSPRSSSSTTRPTTRRR